MRCTSFKDAFKYIQQVREVHVKRGKGTRRTNYWLSQLEQLKAAPNLMILSIAASDLEDVQILEFIASFTQLRELYLWGNHFDSIPDSFTNLQNLRVLSWCRNSFTEADQEILKQLPLLERFVYHPQPKWFAHPKYYYLYRSQKTESHFNRLDSSFDLLKNNKPQVRKTIYFSDLNTQKLHLKFTIAEAKQLWISPEELEEKKLEQFIKDFKERIAFYELGKESIMFQLKKEKKSAKIYDIHLHLPRLREEWAEDYLENYLDNQLELNLDYVEPELEEETSEGLKALLSSEDVDNVRLGLDLIQVQGALPSLWNSLVYLSHYHRDQKIRMLAGAVQKRVIPENIYQKLKAREAYRDAYMWKQAELLSVEEIHAQDLLDDAINFKDQDSAFRLLGEHQAALFPMLKEPDSFYIDHALYEGTEQFFSTIMRYRKIYEVYEFQGLYVYNHNLTSIYLGPFPKLKTLEFVYGTAKKLAHKMADTGDAPNILKYVNVSHNRINKVDLSLLKGLDYLDLSHNQLDLGWLASAIDSLLKIKEVNLLANPMNGFSMRFCFHLAQYPDLKMDFNASEDCELKLSLNQCTCRLQLESQVIYDQILATIQTFKASDYNAFVSEEESIDLEYNFAHNQVYLKALSSEELKTFQFSRKQAHYFLAACCFQAGKLYQTELFYIFLLQLPFVLRQALATFFYKETWDIVQFCDILDSSTYLNRTEIEEIIAEFLFESKSVIEFKSDLSFQTHLRHNYLRRYPERASNIHNIHYTDIYDEGVQEFPQWLLGLPNVVYLKCLVALDKLPLGLNVFKQLSTLSLCFNQIAPPTHLLRQFFQELSVLPLSTLNISGLVLESYLELNEIIFPKSLVQLSLENCSLTAFPESILNLAKLYKLDLKNNLIQELPENIWDLQKLRTLHLEHNQLIQVPLELFEINALEEVFLDGNQVAELDYPFEAIPINQQIANNRVYQYEICTEDYLVEYYTTDLSQYISRIDFALSQRVHEQAAKMAENGKVFLYPKHYSRTYHSEDDYYEEDLERPLLDNLEWEMDHLLRRKRPSSKAVNKAAVYKEIDQEVEQKIQEFLQTFSLSKIENAYEELKNKPKEAYKDWLLEQSQGQYFSRLKQVWKLCNWTAFRAVFETKKKEDWKQAGVDEYQLKLEELCKQAHTDYPNFKHLVGFNALQELLQTQEKIIKIFMDLFQKKKKFRQRIFKYDYALWGELMQLLGMVWTKRQFRHKHFSSSHYTNYLLLIPDDEMDKIMTPNAHARLLLSTDKMQQDDWKYKLQLGIDYKRWYILLFSASWLDEFEDSFMSFRAFPKSERIQIKTVLHRPQWTRGLTEFVENKRLLLFPKLGA